MITITKVTMYFPNALMRRKWVSRYSSFLQQWLMLSVTACSGVAKFYFTDGDISCGPF